MSKHTAAQRNKHDKATAKKHSSDKARRRRREEFKKANIYFIILATALLAAMYFVPLEGWKLRLAYLVPFVAAGWKIIDEALEELFAGNFLTQQLLVTVAGGAALAVGQCAAAVILMLCCSASATVRSYAELKKRRVLANIVAVCPGEAVVETRHGVETVPVDQIAVDDILCVETGESIALDGVVVSGEAELDCFVITGSNEPCAVGEGSTVVSGCKNLGEQLRVRVLRGRDESTIYKMADYVQDYEDFKPKLFRLADKFDRYFTAVAAILGLVLAVVFPLFNGQWAQWIGRGAVLLAIAAPCNLFCSVSLAYFGGIAGAAYRGALIKDANRLELLADSQTMTFAKTGVITEGKYKISGVFPVDMDEESLLAIAATAESASRHPIAEAIRAAGEPIEEIEGEVREFIDIPGRGVSAFFGNSHVYVGNAQLMDEHGIEWMMPTRPGTAVHVAADNSYIGHIIVTDDIREGAFEAIEDLRMQGVKQSVLLTGDVRSASRKIASSLNFEMVKSELGHDEKATAIEYLRATKNFGTALAYVGRGIKDRGLMDCADLGIVTGAFGSEEAFENGDVVIMDDDLRALALIRRFALNSVSIARLNVYITMAVKVLLAVLGMLGVCGLLFAAVADCVISIAIIINSFRTLNQL